MSKYRVICQHSASDTGFERTETNLKRARALARDHVETGSDRPPYKPVAKYVNRAGRAILVQPW